MTRRVIVFDIDGTLADIEHRRAYVASRPKNYIAFNAAMHLDTPHHDIIFLNHLMRDAGHKVILCSGRSEENRSVTENWLQKNNVYFDDLYMRANQDYRKDSIIKVELLYQIKAKHGIPYLWFDDRNQVVDAIRDEGIRVLQVTKGDF